MGVQKTVCTTRSEIGFNGASDTSVKTLCNTESERLYIRSIDTESGRLYIRSIVYEKRVGWLASVIDKACQDIEYVSPKDDKPSNYDDDNNIEIPLGILGESLSSNRRVVIIRNITVFTGIERFLIDDGGDFKFRPCRSSRPDTAVRGDSMRF